MVPIDLGREEAATRARVELSDPAYHRDDQSWVSRAYGWVLEHLQSWLGQVSSSVPGGWLGIAVILLVLVGLIAVLRLRLGPLTRPATRSEGLFGAGEVRSADHYRRTADTYAGNGRHREATRERMRAIVRGLEERSVFDPRPGRTADEAANEAARVLPDVVVELHEAARTFDASWYGTHRADAAGYSRMVALDSAIESSARRHRAPRPAMTRST